MFPRYSDGSAKSIRKLVCASPVHSDFALIYFSVSTVIEEDEAKGQDENGNDVVAPINMAGPNPNEIEFDNLYLDMNGIVCFYSAHSSL